MRTISEDFLLVAKHHCRFLTADQEAEVLLFSELLLDDVLAFMADPANRATIERELLKSKFRSAGDRYSVSTNDPRKFVNRS